MNMGITWDIGDKIVLIVVTVSYESLNNVLKGVSTKVDVCAKFEEIPSRRLEISGSQEWDGWQKTPDSLYLIRFCLLALKSLCNLCYL